MAKVATRQGEPKCGAPGDSHSTCKRIGLITKADIAKVFDDVEIRRLASRAGAKLGSRADLVAFGSAVREAVAIFLHAAATPSNGEVRAEIDRLRALAGKCLPEALASALDELSDRARDLLDLAGGGVLSLPPLPETRPADQAWWAAAAPVVRQLVQFGVVPTKGRQRPDGHCSRSLVPLLWAPKAPMRPTRRDAERELVRWLRLAWVEASPHEDEASGPAISASGSYEGPFVRLVSAVLTLVGAEGVNAVELVNSAAKENSAVTS